MYKLTTCEKIGEQHNLSDDVIDIISNFYLKDCLSEENTLKYHISRYTFSYDSYLHNHKIKMFHVDSEFKNFLRKYFYVKNNNIRIYLNNMYVILYNYEEINNDEEYRNNLTSYIETKNIYNFMKFIKISKKYKYF